MRRTSLVLMCVLLLVGAACSTDTNDVSDPEIRSQADVQRFFDAIMPELVAAFTELANQQAAAASALSSKQNGDSTVPCPEGGSLNVNTDTGQASLNECGARGVVINATLALFVQPTGPSSYQASFNGILTVTGTFIGTVEVVQASVQWTDANTSWQVTVLVDGETYTATSDAGGNGSRTGTPCVWDRSGQVGEVRVHVFNAFDVPGVFVELTGRGVTCAIEDENRELQLPIFGNTLPDGDTLGGLGQALMPLQEAGDPLTVKAWSQDQMSEATCVVSVEAFQNNVPGATAGQAFLDVLGVLEPGSLPTITCGSGFEIPGQTTEIRSGGTCDPGQQFGCDSECFDICLPEEVAQFWECGSNGVCVCTCVNYGF